MKEILQNTWLVLFKSIKDMKSKGSLRNCHIPKRPRKYGDSVQVEATDSFLQQIEFISGKTREIQIKSVV